MAQLIDASVFIAWERHGGEDTAALDALAGPEPAALASVTASELLVGVYRADTTARRIRRSAIVEAILTAFPIIPVDLAVARTHARLWAELASAGQLIRAHDLLIAATALTHDYAVLTDNERHFARVPGLIVRRPPGPD